MIAFLKRYLPFVIFGLAGLLVIMVNFFGAKRESAPMSLVSANHVSRSKVERKRDVRTALMDLPAERSAEALKIAPADIKDMESETELTFPKREISQEDSILMKGGVLEKQSAIVSQDAKRVERQKSIRAEDWEGRGNLLVNELRAGNGFEVSLDQVEAFLRGEDLYGWSEGQRNWIADEMMTMLRQELPAKGYEIFSQIQADSSAPAAMRDYSIQHISHLIADGHVGKEGVAIIRAALESANPATASTALISLQRLSEKAPNLITATEVMSYANRYVDSPDTRLQISARSIQK